jgi:hypothetical protein
VDETGNAPTHRRRTRSQGKTRTFIIPNTASPSEDDAPTKGSISRIKARPTYLRSIQQLFPKSPQPRNAKKAAAARGRGSAQSNADKSAGGDPRRQHRLRRCANQDRSRGRNYSSNRGGHATYDGRVRLDTISLESGNQDCSWRPYVMRTPDAAMRTSAACVHQPWQCSRDGDYNRRRGRHIREVIPQDARSINFFQEWPLPCHKHEDATAVAHLRVASIFVAAHLTRTFPERTYGQLLQLPLQNLLRTWDERVGAGPDGAWRCRKDLNRRSFPVYGA